MKNINYLQLRIRILYSFHMAIDTRSANYEVECVLNGETGNVIREIWRNEQGDIDRLGDQPAWVEYCPITGNVTRQSWWRANEPHRDGDKPAKLGFDPETGAETSRAYWKNGQPHRDEGLPAWITQSNDGMILARHFAVCGRRHRADGPAVEKFDAKSGELVETEYWVDDRVVDPF